MILSRLVLALVLFSALNQWLHAADKTSDLIVGKWQDRAEKDDAILEFSKDGTGTITETTPKGSTQASISWTVTGIYGNACTIVVKYKEAIKVKPFVWLVAFDGKDTFIVQPIANKLVFMDRQK